MTDQPTARLVHAPWNAEQVTALNAFQHTGRMHPFTCGAEHASGQSPMLVATNGGWVCPDPQCTYRQDWAHAFMAVPVVPVSSPPPDQTAHRDRAALSARLWKIAEHHIVAEWICCEPLQAGHTLCAKGYAALGMVKTLLVDADPKKAWNPAAPWLDAVLAELPPPADRAAVLREAANFAEQLMDERYGPDCSYGIGGLDVARELRRLAAEAPQPDTETHDGLRCVCGDPVQLMDDNDPTSWIHSPGSDTRCLEARPRCPQCQLPHDLTPDSMAVRGCESIRASLADADRRHAEGDHGGCARVNCEVLRERAATPEPPPVHKGGNADDCP